MARIGVKEPVAFGRHGNVTSPRGLRLSSLFAADLHDRSAAPHSFIYRQDGHELSPVADGARRHPPVGSRTLSH